VGIHQSGENGLASGINDLKLIGRGGIILISHRTYDSIFNDNKAILNDVQIGHLLATLCTESGASHQLGRIFYDQISIHYFSDLNIKRLDIRCQVVGVVLYLTP